MLYLCNSVIKCQTKTSSRPENQTHLAGFCLLALELSRHRTTAASDSVSLSEHNWILQVKRKKCVFDGRRGGGIGLNAVC